MSPTSPPIVLEVISVWIKTKNNGLINTQNVSQIRDFNGYTTATAFGKDILISNKPTADKIYNALMGGTQFMEVE